MAPPEAGTVQWCAAKMGFLSGALAKYRLLTGNAEFDDLLAFDSGGYLKMRLGHGRNGLTRELKNNASAFRINKARCATPTACCFSTSDGAIRATDGAPPAPM